jgi:hypothetical protein
LKDDVVKEPISIANAEAVAQRLNGSPFSESDLPDDSFYAAAGWAEDGIVRKIRYEMERRFHKKPLDLNETGTALTAYGYLRARVPFTIPYFENTKEFLFTDGEGRKTAIASFGLRYEDEYAYDKLRSQFASLYVQRNDGRPVEFAIDLCKDSNPNQMIIACIPRKEHLQAMVEEVERKIKLENARGLSCNAEVLIPCLNWSVTHHFKELEGEDKQVLNQGFAGLSIDTALQTIDFRLDRSGVELESEAKIEFKSEQINYIVDRPFLIYIKKRGTDRPFFVIWVDNAELLSEAVPGTKK